VHQCFRPLTPNANSDVRDPSFCDGSFPALSGNNHVAGADNDQDFTEADGSKIGNVRIVTRGAGSICEDTVNPAPPITPVSGGGCHGEVIFYDARALEKEDERGAPAALAIVVCKPDDKLVASGSPPVGILQFQTGAPCPSRPS